MQTNSIKAPFVQFQPFLNGERRLFLNKAGLYKIEYISEVQKQFSLPTALTVNHKILCEHATCKLLLFTTK